MSTTAWPKGLVTALVTPLKDDKVDLVAFQRLIDFQIGAGVAGFVVTGGTGEYGALSFDERADLFARAVEYAAGRVRVIAAPACLSTAEAIALSHKAAAAGVAALLLASPFGEPVSWVERLAFYKEVAAAVPLPIMIYNTPPAGLLTFEQIVTLSAIPGITAVKDSSGNPELMGDLLAWRDPSRFTVYVGKDSFLCEAISGGADGAVFGVANFAPREVVDFIALIQSGASLAAVHAQWRSLRLLMRMMESATNYVGLCKAGLALRGIDVGPVRRPYRMPSDSEIAAVADWLQKPEAAPATISRAG